MRKLTRRQITNSLIFPIMTTVWALYEYLIDNIFWGFGLESKDYALFAAVGIGGILCAILTITVGIETGQYFLPRLLILLSTFVVISIADEFLEEFYIINPLLALVSLVFSALFFKKCTKFSEWIIIFLSNPVLYYFGVLFFEMYYYIPAEGTEMF